MSPAAGPQREDGRHLFGRDAAGYARHRPDYPAALWQVLERYRPASGRHFEIGPGTGLATARLLSAGSVLHAIEPDQGMASALRRRFAAAIDAGQLHIDNTAFEQAERPAAGMDAGHAATCFHWLDAAPALARVRQWLRPGGSWAMWWNVFGDPRAPDDFARATADLFAPLAPNPSRINGLPFALDAGARVGELRAAGFTDRQHQLLRWNLTQTTAEVVGLSATFSPVACLPPEQRQQLLERLAERVERVFAGRVLRSILTPIYLARVP